MNDVHKIHWFAFNEAGLDILYIYIRSQYVNTLCVPFGISSSPAQRPRSHHFRAIAGAFAATPWGFQHDSSYRYPLNLTTSLEQELTVDHPDPKKKWIPNSSCSLQESTKTRMKWGPNESWIWCFLTFERFISKQDSDVLASKNSAVDLTWPTILSWHLAFIFRKKTINKTNPWEIKQSLGVKNSLTLWFPWELWRESRNVFRLIPWAHPVFTSMARLANGQKLPGWFLEQTQVVFRWVL